MKQFLPSKISDTLTATTKQLVRYRLGLFCLFVALVYGYIVLTINMVSNIQPSAEQISEQSKLIRATKLDKKIITQLEQLEDNSVSVKALFDKARDNPFQEVER